MNSQIMELRDITRVFQQGERSLTILKGANLTLEMGKLTALTGPSGAGKTSLLNIAGLLEAPTTGHVMINGIDMSQARHRQRIEARRKHIGFVFQFHRLLPEFSAIENVIIPQMLNGLTRSEAADRAEQLLDMVGLKQRMNHRPGLLSGGEQQRVAIIRAIANAPSVLLADEPTGNLDPQTAKSVFSHLQQIVKLTNTAALIVTHNREMANQMDQVLELTNGTINEIAK